jgi:hypothetical protein
LPPLSRALPDRTGVVVVEGADGGGAVYVPSVIRYFERHGVPVRVPSSPDVFGDHRVLRPGEAVRARLVIASDVFDDVRRRRDLRLVSYWGTRPLHQRAPLAEAIRRIRADHDAGRIDDAEAFLALSTIDIGSAVGIFIERRS